MRDSDADGPGRRVGRVGIGGIPVQFRVLVERALEDREILVALAEIGGVGVVGAGNAGAGVLGGEVLGRDGHGIVLVVLLAEEVGEEEVSVLFVVCCAELEVGGL